MKSLTIVLAIAILTIVVLIAGCTGSTVTPTATPAPTSTPLPAPTTRTITDMTGATVTIPSNVTRIGVQYPAMTEVISMLGGSNTIVATYNGLPAMLLQLFPNIASAPRVFTSTVNMESLLETQPQVVIVSAGSNATVNQIEQADIPVVQLSITTPDNLKKAVTIVGEILGPNAEANATKFVNYYNSTVNMVSSRTANLSSSQRVKVYYASADGILNTEGAGTMPDAWITEAGGVNVATTGGISGSFIPVTMEQVLEWNPDVIVTENATEKTDILNDPRWDTINAVKNGQVYVSPSGCYPWCVRSAEAALMPPWTAKILHPELFQDIDMNQTVEQFFSTFYDIQLNATQVQQILYPTAP